MDLLDDSGDEGGKGEAELDENILLNSDDEEGSPVKAHISHNTIDEEELLYEDGDEEEYLEGESEDVLNLELGEDELETPDSSVRHVAPVKLRAGYEEGYGSYEAHGEEHHDSLIEDETGVTSTEDHDHEVSESPSSSSRIKSNADSDDDEDSPRQRTRFLTERKTDDISRHSGPSEGIPIQTLGERNHPHPWHGNPNMGKGNRGGFNNHRGKHFGPMRGGGNPMQLRHRHPSLLGDRPRPALLHFPHRFPPHQQQFNQQGDHLRQLSGGFIDFNQPMNRPGMRLPMKKGPGQGQKMPNIHGNVPRPLVPDQQKPIRQNAPSNVPPNVQQPGNNINTVMSTNNPNLRNPGMMSPKRPGGPRPLIQRPVRLPRGAGIRPGQFIVVDPSNMQGPRGGPRGVVPHRVPGPQNPSQGSFPRQPGAWPGPHQPMGPRGIPVLIPGGGGGPLMQGLRLEQRQEHQFNAFNPSGLPGGPPGFGGEGAPSSGFRQPFLPPNQNRFPPQQPEEMLHSQMQLPPHLQSQQVYLQQQHNYQLQPDQLMSQQQQQQPPPFHGMRPPHQDMGFPRQRAPAPHMQYNQQQLPPPHLRQNEFRFQGQAPQEQAWPMQQQPQGEMLPQYQVQQQPQQIQQQQSHQIPPQQQQQQQQKSRPYRDDQPHHPPEHRLSSLYSSSSSSSRRRDDDYLDEERSSRNGKYEEHHRRERDHSHERYRDYESSSSRDYYEKDYYDKEDDYYSRRHEYEDRPSQYRPPSKRPNDSRDDYRPEKRGYGSPERRLDGRLGPPVHKNYDYDDENDIKHDEAMKITRESQKVTGVDNDYLRKIEEQKEMRARILREKEHRRKKQIGGQSPPREQERDEREEAQIDSRREVRLVKLPTSTGSSHSQQQQLPPPQQQQQVGVRKPVGSTTREDSNKVVTTGNKIYINPRAFRGNLSALKSAHSDRRGSSSSGTAPTSTAPSTTTATAAPRGAPAQQQILQRVVTNSVVRKAEEADSAPGGTVQKRRTILRIVRNKKGEIISKSKKFSNAS